MFVIPFFNIDLHEWQPPGMVWLNNKLDDPDKQRRLVLAVVCVALLLDNMLYMVIVPIIPVYLSDGDLGTPTNQVCDGINNSTNCTTGGALRVLPTFSGDEANDASIGLLFASKAIVQLLVNPLSGTVIDRVGYEKPMLFGLTVIFLSTMMFAIGTNYATLFLARSLQGVGSAFADTSGLAMIADRYTEESSRAKALGIALAFISFGCLFAPPFGGFLYQFAGKCVPFIILAMIALVDGILVFYVMAPVRQERKMKKESDDLPRGTPIYRLIMDPYIAVCAGALVMANVSLAFIEPTIARWMKQKMDATEWEIGLVWLPAFFPHVFGVYLTVKLIKKYPSKQWLITAVGLAIEGFSCLLIPFCTKYLQVIFPIMIDCFGIALVDTAILPTLGYLVDVRHSSVYGSVYAIADISYSLAYAFGPIVAGSIVISIGFTWLNVGIFISNIIYAPLLAFIRHVYDYKPFENEILMEQQPDGGGQSYQTYTANNETGTTPKQDPNYQNHVNQTDPNVYNQYDPTTYNSQPPPRPPPPPPSNNPFRSQESTERSRIIQSPPSDDGGGGNFRPY